MFCDNCKCRPVDGHYGGKNPYSIRIPRRKLQTRDLHGLIIMVGTKLQLAAQIVWRNKNPKNRYKTKVRKKILLKEDFDLYITNRKAVLANKRAINPGQR